MCCMVFFVLACANDKSAVNKDYSWLEGNWINGDETNTETWNIISKQSFNGIGYVHSSDTIRVSEYLRLYLADGSWNLEAKVIGQNDGKEILFRESSLSTFDKLVVENKNHNFPKTISYQYKNQDTIAVFLNEGISKELRYHLIRRREF